MSRGYLTAPLPLTTMPPGIPYIVGNEAAERFSFYGMKAILAVYMTKYLIGSDGSPAPMSDEDAKSAIHLFVASAYFFPLLGALLADALLGKYRTIMTLSLVYCLGHALLAWIDGRLGLMWGLTLIAIGSGGIKPCVSAHVGDQFGPGNQHLLTRVFSWFYFSINVGAFFSTLLTPWLLSEHGYHAAFGVPGILMALATLVFWLGRWRYAHIPPGGTAFLRESFSGEGLWAIARLIPLFAFVSVFWALFDQTSSAWVLQAEKMDRTWLGVPWQSSQVQAANPILVLILIPLFSYAIYPALDRVLLMTPLRRIAIGLFIMVVGFGLSAWIEMRLEPHDAILQTELHASRQAMKETEKGEPSTESEQQSLDKLEEEILSRQIAAGERMNIGWQLLAYVFLTASEVMVSITCLEFSYTQAPNRMKSLIMSLYLLSVSAGNLLTSAVNQWIKNADGTNKLPGDSYYWFFTLIMLITAVLFLGFAKVYRGKTYIQETEPVAS